MDFLKFPATVSNPTSAFIQFAICCTYFALFAFGVHKYLSRTYASLFLRLQILNFSKPTWIFFPSIKITSHCWSRLKERSLAVAWVLQCHKSKAFQRCLLIYSNLVGCLKRLPLALPHCPQSAAQWSVAYGMVCSVQRRSV